MEKAEIIAHLQNMRFAIDHATATKNEFNDMGFVRAHLSFLVNMRYITKISGYVMTLTTGKKIPVPKARYAQVKREYMLYKGEE